jgi:hypothetical protein
VTVQLDFAPGTSEDCQRLVQQIQPGHLYEAYRRGRESCGTGDLVLTVDGDDLESFRVWPRSNYVAMALRRNTPAQLATITLASKSAHQVMLLPRESDVFWLVIEVRALEFPIMCVLHASRHVTDGGEITVLH